MKYTFVLVSAKECTFCKKVKAIWPEIKTKLKGIADIDDSIEIQKTSSQLPAWVPNNYRSHINWFPTMSLFPSKDWLTAKGDSGSNMKLRFKTFNAELTDKGTYKHVNNMQITVSDIVSWVRSSIAEMDKPPAPQLPLSRGPEVKPPQEYKDPKRVFEVHSKSVFVPTCSRTANITPSH